MDLVEIVALNVVNVVQLLFPTVFVFASFEFVNK